MERSQRGLSSFGMLIVLAVVAALGYYAYKAISARTKAELQECVHRLHAEMPAHDHRSARRAGLPGGVPARPGGVRTTRQ